MGAEPTAHLWPFATDSIHTHHPCVKQSLLTLLVLAFAVVGCNDRRAADDFVVPPGLEGIGPDLGFVDTGIRDRPVPSLCVPGARRCLGENSPLYERCSGNGESYVRESCPGGEVCRQGQCVAFTCVPDRPICLGTDTNARCDSTGEGFVDLESCPDSNVCLGGACTDTCEVARQTDSYLGCSYVARRLANDYELDDDNNAPWAIVVANPESFLDASVTVRSTDGRPARVIESVRVRDVRGRSTSRLVKSEILVPGQDNIDKIGRASCRERV